MTQVPWQLFCHVDNPMQVVGHELEGEEPYLGVALGNLTPALRDAFS